MLDGQLDNERVSLVALHEVTGFAPPVALSAHDLEGRFFDAISPAGGEPNWQRGVGSVYAPPQFEVTPAFETAPAMPRFNERPSFG